MKATSQRTIPKSKNYIKKMVRNSLMSEAIEKGRKKLATVDKIKTKLTKAVRDPKRCTHGLSQQNMVLGLSPREMACKAESCGRRRERLVITLTGSWRFQRAILPFENNNNGG